MERRKFEDSFKEAFNGAEVGPSDNVWTGIELELEKAEGEKTRRRLFFYKMLAAASVTFAVCVAGIGYYAVNSRPEIFNGPIASNQGALRTETNTNAESTSPATVDQSLNNGAASASSADTPLVTSETASVGESQQRIKKDRSYDTSTNNGNSTTLLPNGVFTKFDSPTPPTQVVDDNLQAKYEERALPSFYRAKDPQLVIEDNRPDPGALLLARLAAEERAYAAADKKEKEHSTEKLWTSVGFAAGGFSSVNTAVSPPPSNNIVAFSNSSVPDKQANASGVAYSVGVNVGTKLSKRWIIQGGVNYLTQSSDYTATNVITDTNFANLKAESINELDQLPQLADAYAASTLAPTFPYSVNNNVKFFSVPVQAGYLLVNRKFGLQLNAGVSTDLFLQNTITPQGGSLDKTTQGRGEDSPYRSVNFSGLMGTELSYRIGTHYRVALNPGVRYPLNSVYKADVGVQSTPLTFDVGLRFRYIFH